MNLFGSVSRSVFVASLSGAAALSFSQINFSNVSITGSLSGGASFSAGSTYIDFTFPNARVGDGEAVRSGNITITYNAASQAPMIADDLLISVLGALSGTGKIFFNEVIEDFQNPQSPVIIGTHNAVLTNNSQLPYTHHIVFSAPSTSIRVKKEFTLTANPDESSFDFASVGLVQQSISLVPEPGTLLGLGAGFAALAAARKRRR